MTTRTPANTPDDAFASECYCLQDNGKRVCVTWNETRGQASIATHIDSYTVNLPPAAQIPVGPNIIGTTDVAASFAISARQAWQLADWIQQTIPKPTCK